MKVWICKAASLLLGCLLLLCSGSCTTRHRMATTPLATKPVLSVQILQVGDPPLPIAPLSSLHQGERVRMHVTLGENGYLYVAQVDPTGAVDALFPSGPEQLQPAGTSLTLPRTGNGYLLTAPAGEEAVVAIASRQPLGQVDPELCLTLRLPCKDVPVVLRRGEAESQGSGKENQGSDKSKVVDINGRGGRTWLGEDHTLHGTPDERGIVLLRFSFRQVP